MQDNPPPASETTRWLKLLLKIAVTTACLWYVSGKINFALAGAALKKANGLFLFAALLIFVLSKWIAALRLNIYFRNIGIHLREKDNLRLYWLGMFYNLFLPGSIGGDAYKVIVLTKKYKIPYKKTMAAVLLDRFSGLVGLGLILAVYGLIGLKMYTSVIIATAVFAVLLLYFVIKSWLKDFIPSFIPTLILGIMVQATQVVCVYLIMAGLHIPGHHSSYIFIFLLSSVVAVLPLTIGGLGAREMVFLEGSKYFGLLQETSVVISILFYLVTLFTSAWGSIWVFKNPLREAGKTDQ